MKSECKYCFLEAKAKLEAEKLNAQAEVERAKGMAEARIPNMRGIMAARTKPLSVLPPATADELTSIVAYDMPAQKSGIKMIDADNMDELVRLLHEEAKVI